MTYNWLEKYRMKLIFLNDEFAFGKRCVLNKWIRTNKWFEWVAVLAQCKRQCVCVNSCQQWRWPFYIRWMWKITACCVQRHATTVWWTRGWFGLPRHLNFSYFVCALCVSNWKRSFVEMNEHFYKRNSWIVKPKMMR